MNDEQNTSKAQAVGNPTVGDQPSAPAPLARTSGSLLSAATLAVRLNDQLDTMKTVHGAAWPAESRPYRDVIQSHMERNPKFELMEVVLRLAQRASKDKQEYAGLMFLAVGAEMAAENTEVSSAG